MLKAMDEDADLISSVAAAVRQNGGQQQQQRKLAAAVVANKPLLRLSRGNSVESQPPRSPFQSNPLLTAHDYAKSPLMEGCPEPPQLSASAMLSDTHCDDNNEEEADKSEGGSSSSKMMEKNVSESSSCSNRVGHQEVSRSDISIQEKQPPDRQEPDLGGVASGAGDECERRTDEAQVGVGDDSEMTIIPIGSKPHTIGALAFLASNSTVNILYDHPIKSKNRTDSVGAFHLYRLTKK